jgi:hypothetical protein
LTFTACTKRQIETAEKSLLKRYRVLPAVPDFLKDPSYSFSLLYQVIFTPVFQGSFTAFSPDACRLHGGW